MRHDLDSERYGLWLLKNSRFQKSAAKLNHKRAIIIHKNDDAPYDPLTDPEPEGNPNYVFNRPTPEERRKWEAWKKRQDDYYSAHPEVPRP
jgi:hypothetical protein